MLEDFEDLDSASFLEDLEVEYEEEKPAKLKRSARAPRNSGPERLVFGMFAWQRFIISVELFFMVLLLGVFFLMVNDSIALFQ